MDELSLPDEKGQLKVMLYQRKDKKEQPFSRVTNLYVKNFPNFDMDEEQLGVLISLFLNF